MLPKESPPRLQGIALGWFMYCLRPPPGSDSQKYGIVRSFCELCWARTCQRLSSPQQRLLALSAC